MKWIHWLLAAGCSASAVLAQPCPAPNFLQGAAVPLYQPGSIAGLVRQADGSFTRYRYQKSSPYGALDVVPDYQSAFLNCTGVGARTFKTPPGWVPLANQLGETSQPMLFANFLGNGIPVWLAVVPAGGIGPTVDSLLIAIPNSDGSDKSYAYYPVPPNPAGLLVADVNNDGKQDVVVVSYGANGASPNTLAVFLGNGDGTVQPGVVSPAGAGASAAVVYDFNGDDKLDVAVLTGNNVAILLGHGDGTFAAPVNYSSAQAFSMALGDLNGDGKADLVLGGQQTLSVLMGNGNGTFQPAVNLTETFTANNIVTGDFNKDGKLDLAIIDSNGGTLSILLGNGTGGFTSQYEYGGSYDPTNLMAVDLDGDGNLDLLVGEGNPDVLTVNVYSSDIFAYFGRGDGTFIGPPLYTVGPNLTDMLMADFNGDGKLDVAVAAGQLWILISNGNGTYQTPIPINIPGVTVSSVATADFNGDGKPDLVIGDFNGSGIYVLLGKGNGTFQAPVPYSVGGDITSIAVADFNGDRKTDIAACGDGTSPPSGSTAGVLLGNGDGTFQAVKTLTGFGSGPHSLTVGDLNNDGKPDLAIANQGNYNSSTDVGSVLVYLGLGNGSFQSPVSYPAGLNPGFIVAADLAANKATDLLVTTEDPNFATNFQYDIGVMLGAGNGTFQPTSLISTEFGPSSIAVADMTGSGKQDLVIGHCCGLADVTIMNGNGDGTFQPEVEYPGIVSPATLRVADVNGDGKPDIVAGINGLGTSSFVGVFLNISEGLTNVNGASFLSGPLAPNSFATAQGTGLADTTESTTAPYPTTLGGTTVKLTDSSGVSQLAPLAYVSSTQVNYIVPGSAALGPATVTVTASGGATSTGTVNIAAIGPGIFEFGGTELAAADVLVVNGTTQTYENVYSVNSSGALVPAPIDVSESVGQVYLVLYATGLRGHSSASNSVIVAAGGANLPVSYAGAQPQYPGLDQIDVLLPPSLAGKGDVTIQITVDGQAANPAHVTIQ